MWIPGLDGEAAEELAVVADAPATAPRRHTVQPGDSLWAIARRYRLEVDSLARNNGISPADIILPGQQLLLTAEAVADDLEIYRVRRGDTLGQIASRAGVPLAELLRWNAMTANETIFPGQIIRIAPIRIDTIRID